MCPENLIWNLALLSLVTSSVQKSKVQKRHEKAVKETQSVTLMRCVYRFNIVWNVTIDWISVSAGKYSAGWWRERRLELITGGDDLLRPIPSQSTAECLGQNSMPRLTWVVCGRGKPHDNAFMFCFVSSSSSSSISSRGSGDAAVAHSRVRCAAITASGRASMSRIRWRTSVASSPVPCCQRMSARTAAPPAAWLTLSATARWHRLACQLWNHSRPPVTAPVIAAYAERPIVCDSQGSSQPVRRQKFLSKT